MNDRIKEIEARLAHVAKHRPDDEDVLPRLTDDIRYLLDEVKRLRPYESVAKSSQVMLFEMADRIKKLEAVRKAAKKVEHMLNIEDGYEGYVDTDTAAELAEALVACEETNG